ncbi:MAG: methyltransferase domain-containing protein [Mesorhizobium sp.]|nr:MAG: methyltransferase domain-containing protein [Mesorhizobium sp.]
MPNDFWMFFRTWLSAPLRVAAVAPSGKALARIMTQEITVDTGPVVELGPGTGVFTSQLLARGVRPEHLTLVEYGAEFARHLQSRFPGLCVLQMDAAAVGDIALKGGAAGAVISGLPLLSMPDHKVIAILDGAFSLLRPGGAFYQFTYGPRCPVPRPILEGLELHATRIGRTFQNVPPATVYRISRLRARDRPVDHVPAEKAKKVWPCSPELL